MIPNLSRCNPRMKGAPPDGEDLPIKAPRLLVAPKAWAVERSVLAPMVYARLTLRQGRQTQGDFPRVDTRCNQVPARGEQTKTPFKPATAPRKTAAGIRLRAPGGQTFRQCWNPVPSASVGQTAAAIRVSGCRDPIGLSR